MKQGALHPQKVWSSRFLESSRRRIVQALVDRLASGGLTVASLRDGMATAALVPVSIVTPVSWKALLTYRTCCLANVWVGARVPGGLPAFGVPLGSFQVWVGARAPGGLPAFGLLLGQDTCCSTKSLECPVNVVRVEINVLVAAALPVAPMAHR